jgi:hypothetical protein
VCTTLCLDLGEKLSIVREDPCMPIAIHVACSALSTGFCGFVVTDCMRRFEVGGVLDLGINGKRPIDVVGVSTHLA